MIGGMVGNNSCGSNSIAYGSTRDHLVRVRGFLADGSEVTFGPLSGDEFAEKCAGPDSLETRIYRGIDDLLGNPANRRLVRDSYPRPEVTRRNTGYALDALMDASCFDQVFDSRSERPFNFCRLLAGSEGTLFFGVEYELNLIPLPPPARSWSCTVRPWTRHCGQRSWRCVIATRRMGHGCRRVWIQDTRACSRPAN
jgi:FAD/FMN-containing dehydrogenase